MLTGLELLERSTSNVTYSPRASVFAILSSPDTLVDAEDAKLETSLSSNHWSALCWTLPRFVAPYHAVDFTKVSRIHAIEIRTKHLN